MNPGTLMFGSTIALFSAFVMLVILPPGPASAMLVCGSMLATIVMGMMLLGSQRSGDRLRGARLTGRSSFAEF